MLIQFPFVDNVINQINLKLANLPMSQLDWTPDISIGKETNHSTIRAYKQRKMYLSTLLKRLSTLWEKNYQKH